MPWRQHAPQDFGKEKPSSHFEDLAGKILLAAISSYLTRKSPPGAKVQWILGSIDPNNPFYELKKSLAHQIEIGVSGLPGGHVKEFEDQMDKVYAKLEKMVDGFWEKEP